MSIEIQYEDTKPQIKKVIVELDEKDFLLFGAVCGRLPCGNKNAYNLFMKACSHFGENQVKDVLVMGSGISFKNIMKFIDK